jgi:hypothetical protein
LSMMLFIVSFDCVVILCCVLRVVLHFSWHFSVKVWAQLIQNWFQSWPKVTIVAGRWRLYGGKLYRRDKMIQCERQSLFWAINAFTLEIDCTASNA